MIHIGVFLIGFIFGFVFTVSSPIFLKEWEEYKRAKYKRTELLDSVKSLRNLIQEGIKKEPDGGTTTNT